jgi:glycine/serine hydroxymethyltransferase
MLMTRDTPKKSIKAIVSDNTT